MPLVRCPRCGELLHNSRICRNCDTNVGEFEDLICVGCAGTLRRCPGCKAEISSHAAECPHCGFDIKSVREKICSYCRTPAAKTPPKTSAARAAKPKNISALKRFRTLLCVLTAVFIFVSGIFFYKGWRVKNNYRNSDSYLQSENAYVGGDAYNYIINGTYFTGYMVLGTSCMVGSMILLSGAIYISLKIRE